VLLGRIALAAQAIPPIPTHFSVVCLSVCLLQPFDGFRGNLAGTLVGSIRSNDTLC